MIQLIRAGSTPFGTFGTLVVGDLEFVTLECPWEWNRRNVSCIPLGTYRMIWRKTSTSVPPEFDGHTWGLRGGSVDVGRDPWRSGIVMHAVNVLADVEGCIGVGMRFGVIDGKWGIVDSMDALRALYELVGPQDDSIQITQGAVG